MSQQTVINHFASKEGLLEAVAEQLDPEQGRAGHRSWVARAFADQLPDLADPGYARALNLHIAATDVSTWKLLRRDMGLSLEQTIAHMRALVAALATAAKS